jgi:hypothetical protein
MESTVDVMHGLDFTVYAVTKWGIGGKAEIIATDEHEYLWSDGERRFPARTGGRTYTSNIIDLTRGKVNECICIKGEIQSGQSSVEANAANTTATFTIHPTNTYDQPVMKLNRLAQETHSKHTSPKGKQS